jgi:hypothetical protein
MGMKKPGLRQTLDQINHGMDAPETFGRRRVVIQCHHGDRRYDVGEVRGHALFGTSGPHDLRYCNYEVLTRCTKCPGMTGLRALDTAKIREALRRPRRGVLKLDVTEVAEIVSR